MDSRAGVGPELSEGPCHDGAPLSDDADPVGERLNFGKDVAGQQDRASFGLAFADGVLKVLLHQRIETGRWFVQDQQFGIGCEGCNECDLLPVALGVALGLAGRVERDQLGAPLRTQAAMRRRQDVEALASGEPGPQ